VGKKKCRYAFPMASAGVRAYIGVLGGTAPPVGSRGFAPGQGAKPHEADDISASLDYICEINLTPEFIIMGVYLSGVPLMLAII